jgi:hypothetical protein
MLLSALLCRCGFAQSYQPQEATPHDLSKWQLICFCEAKESTPHFAVQADTNGQILYFAQSGATKTQLEKLIGSPILTSQLALLQDWRLLKRNGETYTTNIPVLGPEKNGLVRAQMRDAAIRLVPEIRPNVQKIASVLKQKGLSDNLYSVIFSYVFDGLPWEQLKANHATPDLQLTADHPFWDGAFWAIYPPRTDVPGTNSSGSDGITLHMTWTSTVLEPLNALQSAPNLHSVLQRVAEGNCRNLVIEDEKHNSWNLSRPDGSCAFPVIHEKAEDPIHAAGEQIAQKIAAAVLESDTSALVKEGATPQQAYVIEAHELIWEVLSLMTQQGVLQQPAVLHNPTTDTRSLLPLLLVTVEH